MFVLYFAVLVILTFVERNVAEDLIVQLPEGKIRGHVLESWNGKPYYGFQEIPYAAPPVGARRLQLPVAPEPWSGILDTTKNTVVCYQLTSEANLSLSEDCLHLNVYTPVMPGSPKRLPVLVWIHGGSFTMGSGAFPYVGPKFLIDEGIVVVSINYRLGPLGFLSTNDEVIPGNLGLKDQLLALEWVNENIELFGGNSSHVTISGESAGSWSVGLHLMGPWPKGKALFNAAILESGSELYESRSNTAKETAFKVGRAINSSFVSNDTTELLRVLQNAPVETLVKATSTSVPYIESDGPFSHQMFECYENGNFKNVPILIGFNSEEYISLSLDPNLKDMAASLDRNISTMIRDKFNISSSDRIVAGQLLKSAYTNTSFQDDIGAYIRYRSDSVMGTPITKQAELHSKYNDVYLYQFSYKGQLGGQMMMPIITGAERVGHVEELKYLWEDQTNSDLSKFPAEDRVILHRMVKMWTDFVKYHNPTPVKDPLLQNITWNKVAPNNVTFLNINETMKNDVNPRYYDKVKKVMDKYISPRNII